MKKCFVFYMLAIFVAGGTYAKLPLSAGGGLFFDGSFNNGVSISQKSFRYSEGININSFGGFIFFDAAYAEAGISFGYGVSTKYVRDSEYSRTRYWKDSGYLMMSLSLLGKYPISLGSITFYPALGLEYNLVLAEYLNGGKVNRVDESVTELMSQFGILTGVGFDFPLNKVLYIRTQALFNLRFASKFTNYMFDSFNKFPSGARIYKTPGIGPKIKIGLGFKF